jgi:hypothetical protein
MKTHSRVAASLWTILLIAYASTAPANPFGDNWAPSPMEPAFRLEDYIVWGGSVTKAEDGRYYMFAARWPKKTAMPSWVTNGDLVLAVSDKPTGPYRFVQVVLPRRGSEHWDGMATFNPTIRRHKGKYVLFYTGTTYDFEQPKTKRPSQEEWEQAWNNKRIGVAVSDSVLGPWKRSDSPVLEPRKGKWDTSITSNPAPVLHDDGSALLVYKSSPLRFPEQKKKNELILGAAEAKHYLGPYERLNDESQIMFQGKRAHVEDPYVWFDGENYHMLVKSMDGKIPVGWGSGFVASSPDGLNWKLADPPLAYTGKVEREDGSILRAGRFERPQILFENGIPTHVFFACMARDGIYNVVRPLKK